MPPNPAPLAEEFAAQLISSGGSPFIVVWSFTQSFGHVALVAGFASATTQGDVFGVLDPWAGPSWQSYEYLNSYGGQAEWTQSYFNL